MCSFLIFKCCNQFTKNMNTVQPQGKRLLGCGLAGLSATPGRILWVPLGIEVKSEGKHFPESWDFP